MGGGHRAMRASRVEQLRTGRLDGNRVQESRSQRGQSASYARVRCSYTSWARRCDGRQAGCARAVDLMVLACGSTRARSRPAWRAKWPGRFRGQAPRCAQRLACSRRVVWAAVRGNGDA
eukprot:1242893-Alexandrium_andersonii.AAC.2